VARGVQGVVIDGHVRDTLALQRVGLPVFARGLCVRGTAKHPRDDSGVAAPIKIGDVVIRTGDLVMGDADGAICVPVERLDGLLDGAARRLSKERGVLEGLQAGERSLDLLGIDP
jgi:4-hydroxy-4-methyl-2-oxoglutarate aldolase